MRESGAVGLDRGWTWPKACGMGDAADARRPERAVIMRPGVPCRNMAAAVDAPDNVNGGACRGIGVNGPSAWGISPDGESGGVIQENGLPCRRHADFAMQVNPGFRGGEGKGQEGRYGASGTTVKKVFSDRLFFIGFLNGG